jgi:hypothetical protein
MLVLALSKGLWTANVTETLAAAWDVHAAYVEKKSKKYLRVFPKNGEFTGYFIEFGIDFSNGENPVGWAIQAQDPNPIRWFPLWEAPGFSNSTVQEMFGRSSQRAGKLDLNGLVV